MNTVKNLNINRNAKALTKKRKLRPIVKVLGTTAIISTILMSIILGGGRIIEEAKAKPAITISEYYGDHSKEYQIMEYINISEKINKLNLDTFTITDDLYDKHNISNDLKTPDEINDLLNDFTKINAYISSKDIVKQSKNIEIVLNLCKQEKLVNRYIYEFGYATANENIKMVTKKYAAEVFGVEDYNRIYFKYTFEKSNGDEDVIIFESDKHPDISYDAKKYLTGFYKNKLESDIIKGVSSMNATSTIDSSAAYNYDESRNDIIKKALLESIELEKKVEEEDLYNENMANKLK